MSSYMYVTTLSEVKHQEKEDVKKLSEQLNLYVQRVRKFGESGANSAAFLATLRSVEEEVIKLKARYENELALLRYSLEEANKTKNDNSAETEKFQRVAKDFVDRFQVEADKNGRLISDVTLLNRRVSELEHELKDARDAYVIPQRQLADVQAEFDNARARISALTHELEHQGCRSAQLTDKVASLQQQLDFKDQLHAQQLKDANSRAEQSKAVITELEAKAKQMEANSASLPNLLDQMKRKTEEELRMYKEDMMSTTAQQFAEMKIQMEGLQSTIEHLRQVNANLQSEYDTMEIKVRESETKVKDSHAQICFLEELLKQEKTRAADQTRDLERKLRDLQMAMMNKMAEVDMNKDLQVSLRAEIEAMRLILAEEENRLGALRNQASQQYVCMKPAGYDDVTGYFHRTNYEGKTVQSKETPVSCDCIHTRDLSQKEATFTKLTNTGSTEANMHAHGMSMKTSVGFKQGNDFQSKSGVQGFGHKGGKPPIGPIWNGQNSHSVVYKQTRSRSCHDGFPKISSGSKGSQRGKITVARQCDVRGDGSIANTQNGYCRYSKQCFM